MRYTILALGVGLLIGTAWTAARDDTNEYKDKSGTVRLMLGVKNDAPVIEMYDKDGKPCVTVRSDGKQSHVQLIDPKTGDTVLVTLDGNGPSVILSTEQNRQYTTLDRNGVQTRSMFP